MDRFLLRLLGGVIASAAVVALACQGPEPMTLRPDEHPVEVEEP